eukprot:m.40456 g.40456  ORF g.40456 m.40456 type:complete len:144 (-) comp45918_c0_seq1:134-565(-)
MAWINEIAKVDKLQFLLTGQQFLDASRSHMRQLAPQCRQARQQATQQAIKQRKRQTRSPSTTMRMAARIIKRGPATQRGQRHCGTAVPLLVRDTGRCSQGCSGSSVRLWQRWQQPWTSRLLASCDFRALPVSSGSSLTKARGV